MIYYRGSSELSWKMTTGISRESFVRNKTKQKNQFFENRGWFSKQTLSSLISLSQDLPLLLLLLLLSCFSCVRLCVTPQTAAHQALPSLGFSRQEHWSGLPFPSPMHESETEVLSRVQLFATPWPAAFQAPPFMGFSRQECWSGVPLPSPYLLSILQQIHLITGFSSLLLLVT